MRRPPRSTRTDTLFPDTTLFRANGTLGLGGTSDMQIPTELAVGGPWAAVSAGNSHNLAIAADGSLWGWGYNADGRVGDGSQTSRLVPTRIGTDSDWVSAVAGGTHSMAIKSDGSLWSWGDNEYGQLGHGDRKSTRLNSSH